MEIEVPDVHQILTFKKINIQRGLLDLDKNCILLRQAQ